MSYQFLSLFSAFKDGKAIGDKVSVSKATYKFIYKSDIKDITIWLNSKLYKLMYWCATNHKKVLMKFIYVVVEVALISFIITSIYKFFVLKLIIGLTFSIF